MFCVYYRRYTVNCRITITATYCKYHFWHVYYFRCLSRYSTMILEFKCARVHRLEQCTTLYCQKYSVTHWIQEFWSPPWPQLYIIKHLRIKSASTNICEIMDRSWWIAAWHNERMPPVQQIRLWNWHATKYSNCSRYHNKVDATENDSSSSTRL